MFIHVKVLAGSKKELIEKIKENKYHISVKQKAERNMANGRVCEIIASVFKIKRGDVRIVNGHQSPSKILSVKID